MGRNQASPPPSLGSVNSHQRRIRARDQQRQAGSAPVMASLGKPVLLAVAVAESDGPVWVECCLSGTYLGHPKAKVLDWGPSLFQELTDTLHAHPGFRAGPDGVGTEGIIPWDYEHQSEIAKMLNAIPKGGCPSEAWTLDFKVSPGADGKPAFFALTQFLPQARQQIREGKYKWCSIAVDPDFSDPVTNEKRLRVSSIALTNDPFIQGMVPLAATRRGMPITQTLDQWGPAESPEEALIGLRKIFQIDDNATAQDVLKQIQTLRGLIESGTIPGYLDVECVLDRMRTLLEFPLLSLPADILGGAERIVSQLITGGSAADPSAPSTSGEQTMPATLNVALASRLKCETDDASILLAVAKKEEQASAASEATDAFAALRKVFGGDDMKSVIANATKAAAEAKQLGPALEALGALEAAMKGQAETDATNETEVVAASLARKAGDPSFAETVKPTILQARKACFDQKTGIVDEKALAKFRDDYKLDEESRTLLTRRVVAGPNGVQLGGSITGYQTQPITQSAGAGGAAPKVAPELQKVVDAFNSSPGRNAVEKANSLLCSRSPQHKSMDFAQQCRVAGDFVRELSAGKVPAGITV